MVVKTSYNAIYCVKFQKVFSKNYCQLLLLQEVAICYIENADLNGALYESNAKVIFEF